MESRRYWLGGTSGWYSTYTSKSIYPFLNTSVAIPFCLAGLAWQASLHSLQSLLFGIIQLGRSVFFFIIYLSVLYKIIVILSMLFFPKQKFFFLQINQICSLIIKETRIYGESVVLAGRHQRLVNYIFVHLSNLYHSVILRHSLAGLA